MESWRTVWREGFAPVLTLKGLEALRDALTNDDPRLVQGSTTTPPPLMCVQDWPVEAACALGFCGCCFEADQKLGEAAACRWFLNWFDDTPRDEMRKELLAEVERAIEDRAETVTPAAPEGVED